MPELPEVEILVRHLGPLLKNQTVRAVEVHRAKAVRPTAPRRLQQALTGATFTGLSRRGKYLLFAVRQRAGKGPLVLLGHLGMTGRIFLQPASAGLPKHTAVVVNLGRQNLIYEDQRYFGRLTLDTTGLARLGPEPLEAQFTAGYLAAALGRSRQAIKTKLLDQSLVAGIGNIYASEALFRARIPPRLPARKLTPRQVKRLHPAIRTVLTQAIRGGSTLPLDFGGDGGSDGLFYFGRAPGATDYHAERLRVYDRAGQACVRCQTPIRRIVQAARSTYYCPSCQNK